MRTRQPFRFSSRSALAFALTITATGGAAAIAACHNQSTNNDRGQAEHGANPDSTAVPPRPMVAGTAGPASSVAAANLARTGPVGPPNHDGPAVCHVSIGNESLRTIDVENTGNVGILAATAVVYAYDAGHQQIARVEVPLYSADAGAPMLRPRDGVRRAIPIDQKIAEDRTDWIVPVLAHVDFADGAKWDAPTNEVGAKRAFAETRRKEAVN